MDLQVSKKGTGEPLVDQDAAMLGIVDELHDVECAVIALNQVGLCAAAHLADEFLSAHGHRAEIYFTRVRKSG